MPRRRRATRAPGFAILNSDAEWYAGRDANHVWTEPRLAYVGTFDKREDAETRCTELNAEDDDRTWEVLPVVARG